LQNYVDLFTRDNLFWVSLRNSAVYVLLTVTSGIVASLGLTLLMNQKVKGIGLFKVAMFIPVVTPAVAVAFIWSWNDFLGPLLYLNSPENYPLPLALRVFNDQTSTSDYGATVAVSVLALLPILLFFIIFQRFLVEGVSTRGLKR
ncbi:MAG TPA: hypothetical protein PK963_05715, partial [Arachnia sp.]|nr:hypothetical protein [Arachnia sp.]